MDRPQGLASLCPPLLSEDLPTIPGPHPVSGKQPRPVAPWWFSAAGVEARPQEPGLACPTVVSVGKEEAEALEGSGTEMASGGRLLLLLFKS